jgi:hypothetical protein
MKWYAKRTVGFSCLLNLLLEPVFRICKFLGHPDPELIVRIQSFHQQAKIKKILDFYSFVTS